MAIFYSYQKSTLWSIYNSSTKNIQQEAHYYNAIVKFAQLILIFNTICTHTTTTTTLRKVQTLILILSHLTKQT